MEKRKKKRTECEKRWRVGRETKEVRTQNEVRTHTENGGVCSSLPDSTEKKLRDNSRAQNDRTREYLRYLSCGEPAGSQRQPWNPPCASTKLGFGGQR